MIHFDIPKKPRLDDFGLSISSYQEELEKEKRGNKFKDFWSSIHWSDIIVLLLCLFIGYLLWMYNANISPVWRVIISLIEGVIIGEFIVCAIVAPFWIWSLLTRKYTPGFLSFLGDIMDDINEFFQRITFGVFHPLFNTGSRNTKAFLEYKKALSDYSAKIERLKVSFPKIEEYNWDSKRYTTIKLQELLPIVIGIAKKEIESIRVRKSIHWWKSLEPKEFEQEVADWFRKKGYKAEVTQYVADGGVDIIVEKDGTKGYVQCKRYKDDKVSIAVVRQLLGVMASDHISLGFVACINGLSSDEAYKFAERNNIITIDVNKLIEDSPGASIQEKEDNSYYYVGPFAIHKELFISKEEAINYSKRWPELSVSVLRIDKFFMNVYSHSANCLSGSNIEYWSYGKK